MRRYRKWPFGYHAWWVARFKGTYHERYALRGSSITSSIIELSPMGQDSRPDLPSATFSVRWRDGKVVSVNGNGPYYVTNDGAMINMGLWTDYNS